MATESASPLLVADLSPRADTQDTIVVSRQFDSGPKQKLSISFQRTVRVADNATTNNLPPGLGCFPLYNVQEHPKMPPAMAEKGGFFMPMYQREAMWINFKANSPFAIKIYVGGVNAISGDPALETEATMKRPQQLMKENKNIQDYVVAPTQLWLDGIAVGDGTVRQFVATPLGSGYSVEAQMTGADIIGGIQIEVTPTKQEFRSLPIRGFNPKEGEFQMFIRTLVGTPISLSASSSHTIDDIKYFIQNELGIPPKKQHLNFSGKILETGKSVTSMRPALTDNFKAELLETTISPR